LMSVPKRAGTPCNSLGGGGACDGAGHCVQCLSASDCPAGFSCVMGRCALGCADRVKDGRETDVDCGGGACLGCANGRACTEGADCASHVCDGRSHVCVTATCADDVKNGSETDVDCGGGACPTCLDGAICAQDSDCASGECDPRAQRCIPSLCNDHKVDGTETGIDCGGPTCPRCPNFQSCLSDQDCQSGHCSSGRVTGGPGFCYSTSCQNGKKDGTESDADCGGDLCVPCALGRQCLASTDCASLACDAVTGTCVANHCTDHRVDGDETDVDCGGICAGCGSGMGCGTSADCATGLTCTETAPHECH
jgi:hypothetical protein